MVINPDRDLTVGAGARGGGMGGGREGGGFLQGLPLQALVLVEFVADAAQRDRHVVQVFYGRS